MASDFMSEDMCFSEFWLSFRYIWDIVTPIPYDKDEKKIKNKHGPTGE